MRFVRRAPRAAAWMIGGALTMGVAVSAPSPGEWASMFGDALGIEVARAAPAVQRAPAGTGSTGTPLKVLVLLQDQQPEHSATAIYQALGAPLARRGIQLTPALAPAAALTADKLKYYD